MYGSFGTKAEAGRARLITREKGVGGWGCSQATDWIYLAMKLIAPAVPPCETPITSGEGLQLQAGVWHSDSCVLHSRTHTWLLDQIFHLTVHVNLYVTARWFKFRLSLHLCSRMKVNNRVNPILTAGLVAHSSAEAKHVWCCGFTDGDQ